MNILIVCQFFWPDNFLINEISEELTKKGHKITVLTGLPDYATTKVPKKYKFFRNRHEWHNGIEIVRVPIIARRKGFLFRVLNYLSFYINSSIYAKTHKIEADVIFAYQLAPVLMVNAGIIYKKKLKKPLFTYVLDLWPDQMKIWHVNENNILFKIMLKYCKKAYGSADILGITTKSFKEYLNKVCNVENNKMVYLPQHSNQMKISQNKEEKDVVDFIFAGNIGQQQNVECILEAVSKMKTTKKFMVHIYGNGTSYNKCVALNKEMNLENKIKFYGRVDKEELINIYPKMDAFLLTLCSEKEIGFVANTIPAKMQGYMSAGKPIIAAINGGAKEIIEESKCGAAVNSGNSEEYAKILDDFVENPDKYKDCGKNAIQYFNENFEKNVVINKLEKLLTDLKNNKINK